MARTQPVKPIEPKAEPVADAQDASDQKWQEKIDALNEKIEALQKEMDGVRAAIGWMLPPKVRPGGSKIVELSK